MKRIILIIFIGTVTQAHAMFGHREHEQRVEAERRLQQQQELTNNWRTTAFAFGAGSIAALIVGTAIGSKGRRDAQRISGPT